MRVPVGADVVTFGQHSLAQMAIVAMDVVPADPFGAGAIRVRDDRLAEVRAAT